MRLLYFGEERKTNVEGKFYMERNVER